MGNPASGFPLKLTFHSASPLDWRKKILRKKYSAKVFCVSLPLVALSVWSCLCLGTKGKTAFPEMFVPGNRQFLYPQRWVPGVPTEIQKGIK